MTSVLDVKTEKKFVIKCPHCNAEYTYDEIFMPSDIEGKTEKVIKDALGKVLYTEYQENCEPLSTAKYVCDYCDKQFVVEPIFAVKVRKESDELDFSTTTASLI